MASESMLTPEQIRTKGLEALVEKLGPSGMVRFLQHYEPGWGDYSTDRHQWLNEDSVDDVAQKIKDRKNRL